MMDEKAKVPALKVSAIAKTFGGSKALKGIDFSVLPGEVHGLLGQNGSGKSTFVKVLAGYHPPDPGGSISVFGRPLPLPMKAGAFRDFQMAFVHQHLGLIPSLTVLENMRVASVVARKARIDWRAESRAAQATFDRFGIHFDVKAMTGTLSQTDQALLAIMRAAEDLRREDSRTGGQGLLILDEPTPFLPKEGVDRLFDLVRQVVAHGDSVIFISHDIDEVREITDRATILRDGAVSGTLVTKDASHDNFVEGIIGRRVQRSVTKAQPDRTRKIKVSVRGIEEPGLSVPALDVAEGEILGMTGLLGSGYEKVPYLMFGATPTTTGSLTMSGQTYDLRSMQPKIAVAQKMALLPSDRPKASGVASLSIRENMLLLDLERFIGKFGLNRRAMRQRATEIAEEYEVRPNDPSLDLGQLSGGNAQKVLLAKWLIREPELLMLDEPTQGVDVGTRQQVYGVIRDAADRGSAVICASSDSEQLADLCTRVLIFARGRIVDELTGDQISKDNIAEACYANTTLDVA
ncbi:sugar ABC transporter ATP-binding protein [Puniceibacterium sediminis]|uniref:Monosaccharide ABC transporter ATP-binding protein, CUT2 family n=1 Tax=Puniceibacterium sediminis TaxID=1608407 RepID=A0A238X6Q8_9RHOB|nr:sugar ABC transporter ATP-binding protein [Puniceibacterium sediminis]SNR53539.1 monosaccharide ABC transporter ATP-binding protein, CUT2 family [Puniceibacterium sediminis]